MSPHETREAGIETRHDLEHDRRLIEELFDKIVDLQDENSRITGQLDMLLKRYNQVLRERNEIAGECRTRFERLGNEWRAATPFAPSMLEMAMHPSYQQIIGLGRPAISFILQELSRKPDHWFWALKAITGEDPVPEEDRGDLSKMSQAWLAWGAHNGYQV